MKINKVLIRQNKTYYWGEKDLHTTAGVIKEADLKKDTTKVNAHSGKEFFVFPALFIDKIQKIKRLPQAIPEKDIALILTYSSIDNNSVVLEAGTGSGKLLAFLARVANKIISYETNNEYIKIAKKNLEDLDISNVEIKNKDIYLGIDEKNLDLIVLDLPDPSKVVSSAHKSLKPGCFLIAYLPNVNQLIEFMKEIRRYDFFVFKNIELIEREWLVDEKRARPESGLHSAFLSFVRKL